MSPKVNPIIAKTVIFASIFLGGVSMALYGIFLFTGAFKWINLNLSSVGILVFDAILSLLFFFQHSIMVRKGFREWLKKYLNSIYHGAIYSVVSGFALLSVVFLWQESPNLLIEFHGGKAAAFRSLYFISILGFLWSNMAFKGFDPLGIIQIVRFLQNKSNTQIPFVINGPYRYVRHPLYFSSLLMIWSCPVLSADRILFNLIWTIWIVIGTFLEERELVSIFGDTYTKYQNQVPMLIPSWRRFEN